MINKNNTQSIPPSGVRGLHFIAIGGAAMHNLALALHNKGYHVTGSDDAIFEPSKSRLEKIEKKKKTSSKKWRIRFC